MKTDTTGDATDIRDAEVVSWRLGRLLDAGFALEAGEVIALDCGIDLHALLELVEWGCPPNVAARIVAPLVGESRSC